MVAISLYREPIASGLHALFVLRLIEGTSESLDLSVHRLEAVVLDQIEIAVDALKKVICRVAVLWARQSSIGEQINRANRLAVVH